MEIDAFGDFLCWFPDATARLKRRSPVEDDGLKVSDDRIKRWNAARRDA
jgi:hypothetical protein